MSVQYAKLGKNMSSSSSLLVHVKDDEVNTVTQQVNDELRQNFYTGVTLPVEYRLEQLKALRRCLVENEDALLEACKQDLGKCKFETTVTELGLVHSEIKMNLEHLKDWLKPEHPSTELAFKFDGATIKKDPLGVCLIFGAWNYPIQLTLCPLVGAIAGGNCVVLKPSEVSENVANCLGDLLPRYLDSNTFRVLTGSVKLATGLLEERWDHIFYTGNGVVGRIVMTAAAKHLTPVVLELGGKSPCIVHKDVDQLVAAQRIAWGKCTNSGQTCVAPDYLYCHEEIVDEFVEELKNAITRFFGNDIRASADYGRIVAVRHVQRLAGYLEDGEIVFGGDYDEEERFFHPTILRNVDVDSKVMTEEIFGPILPVITYKDIDEVIRFVNSRDKPLSLYVFTNDSKLAEKVTNQTSSGGALVNDVLLGAAVEALPFGGVGPSGMGAYHGKHSFETFTHKKGMLIKDFGMEGLNRIRYAPYTESNLGWVKWLSGYPKDAEWHSGAWKKWTAGLVLFAIIVAVILKFFGGWSWLIKL